jgi:hypothetical protein
MLCGVTVSISVFDTDGIGSNPISTTNGGCSLMVKCPAVNGRIRVRNPTAHPKMAYSSMEERRATNAEMRVRIFLSQQKIFSGTQICCAVR